MALDFDWDRLRGFLATAEHGSFAAAARQLGVSQPTLGRSVQALEEQLGVSLFNRTSRGLTLTETGLELLDHARGISEAATQLALAAEGHSSALNGVVRITASEVFATYRLPKIVTELRRCEPDIEIELIVSNSEKNLLQREADIAIRMYRPEQVDLITRKVGEVELGAFAAKDYLDRRGVPAGYEDAFEHDFIGYDRSDEIVRGFRSAGLNVDRRFFRFRCDDQVVCWQMVLAGAGIGFTQAFIGEQESRVRRVLEFHPMPTLGVWLAAHPELKTSRRVRRVFDFLGDRLAGETRRPC